MLLIVAAVLSAALSYSDGPVGGEEEPAQDPAASSSAFPGSGGPTHEILTPLEVLRERIHNSDLDVLDASVFGDHVDIDTGRLTVRQTDVSLPGNSALPVTIARVLSESTNDMNGLPGPGPWDLIVPHIRQRYLSPNGQPADRCTGFGGPDPTYLDWEGDFLAVHLPDYWSGPHLSIEGADRTLLSDQDSPEFNGRNPRWVTSDHWIVDCLSTSPGGHGEGFLVTDPSGTTYRMDHIISRSVLGQGAVAANTQADFAYVTRVEDVHGNWVNYSYSGSRLTQITSNDGRTITLTWSGYELTRVSANGRHWDYSGDRIYLPDGRYWETTGTADFKRFVDLADPNGWTCSDVFQDITIRHPSGATAVFEFGLVWNGRRNLPDVYPAGGNTNSVFPPGCGIGRLNHPHSLVNNGVIAKDVTIPGDGTHRWAWIYGPSAGCYVGGCGATPSTKMRRLTYPDGHYVDTYVNIDFSWREGLVEEIRTYSATGSLLSANAFTHSQGHVVGGVPLWGYAASNAPATMRHPTVAALTQGGQTYTRTMAYQTNPAAGDFAFGQPHTVTLSSTVQAGSRTTQTTYTHDRADWILGLTSTVSRNGLLVESHGYNSVGLRTHTDMFGARAADMGYNADGTLSWYEDALNRRTTASNWKRGVPQLVTRPDLSAITRVVDDNGWVTSLTDPNGTITSFSRNDMGWLTLIDRPSGFSDTTFSYSGLGSGLVQTATHGALRTVTELDGFHRPTRIERRALSNGGGSIFTRFEYDAFGRTVFASFPSASIANPVDGVDTAYDALGRVIRTEETVAPYAATVTAYLTDNRVRVTDPAGNVTTTWRSGWGGPDDGQTIRIDHPLGLTTQMTYDVWGNLLTARQHGSHSGFSVDETQSWAYDNRLRLCRHSTPQEGHTLYEYDAANQVIGVARGAPAGAGCNSLPAALTVDTTYDAMGRVDRVIFPDSPNINLDHDANGNLTRAARGSAVWTYAYDAMDRVLWENLALDGRSYMTSHRYGADGRYYERVTPSGRSITYAPNGHGLPQRARADGTDYAFNALYHPSGALSAADYGNGLDYLATFDARQQMTSQRVSAGTADRSWYSYARDALGRVTAITDHMRAAQNRSYGYDALGRLTSASGPWGSGSYTYDLLNNIREKALGLRTVELQYDAAGRLDRYRDTDAGFTWRDQAYDGRGNVTSDGVHGFSYDTSGQPYAISGGASGSFVYDAHRRRVKQTLDGETIYSVYGLDGSLYFRDNITTGETTDYVRMGSHTVGRMDAAGAFTWTHGDHLGSASAATDSGGNIVWRESYTPFGEAIETPAANRDEAGFTGHIRDHATGLTYAQARYYNPVIARFYAPDPVGFASGGPGYFNRYAYTMNDPVNATDPTGEAAMDCCQPKHPRGRQPMQLSRGGAQRGANNGEIGRSAVGGIQNQHEPFSTAAERAAGVVVTAGSGGGAIGLARATTSGIVQSAAVNGILGTAVQTATDIAATGQVDLVNSAVAGLAGAGGGGLVSSVPTKGAPIAATGARVMMGGAAGAIATPFLAGAETTGQDLATAAGVGGVGALGDFAGGAASAAAAVATTVPDRELEKE